MGSQERRQREREEVRDHILKAAVDLYREGGPDFVTIRRIAERIEYTPGAIYSYFKDKDDIFWTLHEQGFEALRLMMLSALPDIADPYTRLHEIGKQYITFAFRHPHYYHLMFIDPAVERVLHNRVKESNWFEGDNAYTLLKTTIMECIQHGSLAPGDVDALCLVHWGMLHGVVALIQSGRMSMIPEEWHEQRLRLALEYLHLHLGSLKK